LNQVIKSIIDTPSKSNIIDNSNLKQNLSLLPTKNSTLTRGQHHEANADTGTTGHYIALKDMACLDNVRDCLPHELIEVTMPNGDTIQSTHIGELLVGPKDSRTAHVFPTLWGSLLSIGEFVDHGCNVHFDKTTVRIYESPEKGGHLILQGSRSPQTHNLWMIDLKDNRSPATLNYAATMIPCDTSAQRIQWVHRMYGSPAPSTFINAWDKGWIKIPGITSRAVKQHQDLLHSTESAEGHLDQSRKNAHSTTQSYASRQDRKAGNDEVPLQPTHVLTQITETNHMDATGGFPAKSNHGKQYILIMYSENGNYIKPITMKDRTKESYVKAYREGLQFFESRGLKPTFQRADNEISGLFLEYLVKHNIAIDLVPPGQHRRNRAERAIRTFKNHFIAILAGVDPEFPANLWCSLIQQAEITINALRESTCNPRMSAWEEINGPLDFNRTPMAPPGMRVTVHDKPSDRASWAKHGTPGFYTGPAMDHYRCYTTATKATGATRVTDTLAWHPHGYAMPAATPAELMIDAVNTLSKALHVMAEGNIVSANNAQPLHALIPALDANLLDLVTLFKPTCDEPTSDADAANQRVINTPASDESTSDADAANQRVINTPTCDEPTSDADAANQRVMEVSNPSAEQQSEVATTIFHPGNHSAVPPGFPPAEDSAPEQTSTPATTESTETQSEPSRRAKPKQRQKQKKAASAPAASTQRTQRSQRRPNRYINAAMLLDQEYAMALMIKNRFKGNRNGGRGRPPAPTKRIPSKHYIAQAVRKVASPSTQEVWNSWAMCDGVELDSSGVPFFTSTTTANSDIWATCDEDDAGGWSPCDDVKIDGDGIPVLTANTAVDLDDKGKKLTFPKAMKGDDADIWLREHGVEISKLIDTKTLRPIHWNQLPAGKKATYYSPQVKTKIKNGVRVYRVRGTIGGNHIDYEGDTQAFTAAMQTLKILWNAVVSGNAKFMTADIKDFYLGTPMAEYEYMRVELKQIPLEVQDKYELQKYAKDGVVLMEIMKGIYGLPQAGKLAQDRLIAHLASHGYHQAKHTPCLFTHETRNIAFTLVVDDFGIKYTEDEDAQHLLDSLRELYVMTEEWGAEQKYVGITVKHDRVNNIMTLSMPGYVEKALTRFGASDIRGSTSPITYVPPLRGQKVQMVPLPDDDDTPLTAAELTRVQEIVGVFLFYSRAVDSTMLTALSKISTQQAAPTQRTLAATTRFLQYAKQYPNNETIIRKSDMQLQAQSDASYLSETQARSRAGMVLYFGINDDGSINGIIEASSCIIPTVCSSVAEAEYAALFLAGKEITSARHTLHDLGYPQGSTITRCDNSCAVGIANITVKQKRSKAIDMRYHWVRDQVKQGKMTIIWEAGVHNLADFFTKAHPVWHHKAMMSTFIHTPKRTFIKESARSRRIARANACTLVISATNSR